MVRIKLVLKDYFLINGKYSGAGHSPNERPVMGVHTQKQNEKQLLTQKEHVLYSHTVKDNSKQ